MNIPVRGLYLYTSERVAGSDLEAKVLSGVRDDPILGKVHYIYFFPPTKEMLRTVLEKCIRSLQDQLNNIDPEWKEERSNEDA
uniref:Uncharacterized protein n=1 Tax=viral metagenome TaxID=1070528 RepID=A0A6M3L7F9_9ZZZZ